MRKNLVKTKVIDLEKHDKHHVEVVDMTKVNPKWITVRRRGANTHAIIELSGQDTKQITGDRLVLQEVGLSLAIAMKSLSRKLKGKDANCKVCGGLREEIAIDFDGKQYLFTCHQINSLSAR